MAPSSPPTGDARLAVLAPGGSGGNDPATDVLSTFWAAGRHDAYEARGGTSAAAAYTSGALALLLAEGYNALGGPIRGNAFWQVSFDIFGQMIRSIEKAQLPTGHG